MFFSVSAIGINKRYSWVTGSIGALNLNFHDNKNKTYVNYVTVFQQSYVSCCIIQ